MPATTAKQMKCLVETEFYDTENDGRSSSTRAVFKSFESAGKYIRDLQNKLEVEEDDTPTNIRLSIWLNKD